MTSKTSIFVCLLALVGQLSGVPLPRRKGKLLDLNKILFFHFHQMQVANLASTDNMCLHNRV